MNAVIGIDVSKDKFDTCWLRDASTGKKKSKSLRNSSKGYQEIHQWLLKNVGCEAPDILIVVEPTNVYHEALIHFLYEKGFKVFLANSGKAKKFAESLCMTHKTDKSDAAMLAYYGHAQAAQATLWEPEPKEIRQLKAMMRRLDALEKDLQREKNRRETSEISDVSGRVLQSLDNMIKALEDEIEQLENDIDNHIDHHGHLKKNRELLKSIKGIGPVLSRELTYLFAAKRFKSAKQVSAYLGLIPKQHESGKLKGRTTISKVGPSRLRAKLYMAAVVASMCNPDIKAQKDRLMNAGKCKMEALGAAMRKLVQICFGVVKHQTKYQPQIA